MPNKKAKIRCGRGSQNRTTNRARFPLTSTIPAPWLPNELWILIFEHATYVPGERGAAAYQGFDSQLDLAEEFLSNNGLRLDALLQKQIPRRLSLSLVSKHWHELTLPILYRSIIVTYPNEIHSIIQLLERKSHVSGSVRRLHIREAASLESLRTLTTFPLKEVLMPCGLQGLVARLTNLECIWMRDPTGRITTNLLSKEHAVLRSEHPLQQLKMAEILSPSFEAISAASSFAGLRVIQIGSIWFPLHPGTVVPAGDSSGGVFLPFLEVISVPHIDWNDSIESFLLNSSLPSLHSICVSLSSASSLLSSQFPGRIGRQIRTLFLKRNLETLRTASHRCEIFANIIPSMPNIEQFMTNFMIPSVLLEKMSKETKLRRLHVLPNYDANSITHTCFNPLRVDISKSSPNLEVFKISHIPSNQYECSSIIAYLHAYEEPIRLKGINLNLMLQDGRTANTVSELEEIISEEKAKEQILLLNGGVI